MSRRARIAALVLGLPLLVVTALAALLAWVFATEAGTRWALEQARPYLPEGVGFERAEGVLAGPLTVHGIGVETPAARVALARVRLDWAPSALLWSEIRVLELAVTGVEVALPAARPAAADGAGPALPARLTLPAAVVLERLQVEDVTVRLADGSLQRVERVALSGSMDADGIAVEGLEVSAPLGELGGELQLSSARPYGVDGSIAWQLRLPAPAPELAAGRLQLGGSLRRLRARLAVERPAAADLRLEARLFDDPPAWSASLQAPLTGLRRWWGEAPELSASADLQLEGSFTQASVAGALALEGLPSGPLRVAVDARGSARGVQVERLRVEPQQRPGAALTARGELELDGERPRLDATLDWQDLAWPLTDAARVVSESGTLAIEGSAEAYTFAGQARLRTPQTGAEPVRLEARGAGSIRALSRLSLRADWHQARLEADGRVQWSPTGTAALQLALDRLDPARLAPPLAGRVGARAGLELEWGEALRASLDLESLSGELNGRPLSGSARLHYEAGRARIESLALTAGEARVTASGTVGRALALDWRVEIPQLEALVPGYQGRINGSGRAGGPPTAPRIGFELEAAGLRTPAVDVARLSARGSVAPLGDARSELALEAGDIVTEAVTIESLALRGDGTRGDHRLEATLQSERGGLELALSGALADGDWQGRIRTATLTPERLSRWTLVAPIELAWRGGRLELQRGCWRSDGGRLCAAAAGDRDDWQAELDARAIPLGLVAGFVRADLDYASRFDLQAWFAVAGGGPVTGQARLDLTAGTISGVLGEERLTLLEHGVGRLQAQLQADALQFEAELPLSGDGRVRLDGRLGREPPRALEARLQARIEDLALLNALTPAIGRVEGRLLADLELGGTAGQPSASGSARLEAGRLELLPLGIELTRLRADLATADNALQLTLGARSGDGQLDVELRLARARGRWSGSGTLVGEGFRAVNLPAVTATVSPDVEWRLDGREITVNGQVEVPGARIAPRDLSGAVRASPDAVVVGGPRRAEPEPPFRVIADVTLLLGPAVQIDAFGLDGRLEGSIRVRERPEQLTSATGELRVVDGSYSIYRQTLEIERGRVIFDGGPIANPGLDVRAVRRPRDVVVGVNVRGTLREPRVELFSEPAMEQSQQLAYLIVGVPLRETTSGQESSVAAAAAALATSEKGTQLAGRVGIQEVSVDPGDPGEGASLVLGRYLSPRLYVGYGVGLAEQANSVRMRYSLTDHWALEARSGVTSSADLLYSIEVDSSVDAIPELPLPGQGASKGSAAQ